ncbi:MAG TPA: DMT family protein [Tepidisphaeraceae bacterium]|nr:DMT family protein [Tepidisphaeraceae bacterium]
MTYLPTIVLLLISNTFMTFAWYGHLKFEQVPLWKVILVSWGIAFLEYVFQVPANRIGNMRGLSGGQLKIIQEVITLIVFVVFARMYLGERLTWNYYVAFGFILAAVFFVFNFRPAQPAQTVGKAPALTQISSVAVESPQTS